VDAAAVAEEVAAEDAVEAGAEAQSLSTAEAVAAVEDMEEAEEVIYSKNI
jgi:hypothetical protein